MAIQELNATEIQSVTGAGLFDNLGNGALNPVNGLVNLLTNLDLGGLLTGLVGGVLGLVARPQTLLEAIDLGGIVSVLGSTLSGELNFLLGGLFRR